MCLSLTAYIANNEDCWFPRGEAQAEGLMKCSGWLSLTERERGHEVPFKQESCDCACVWKGASCYLCLHAYVYILLKDPDMLTRRLTLSLLISRLHYAVQEQAVAGCVLFHQLHRSYGSSERTPVPAYVWKSACWTRVTIWAANSPGSS